MISSDVIKNLANKLQTTELNIRREYVQHIFLSHFYQHPATGTIYFKGGTALRFMYKSPRFSEDLDFSASKVTINSIEDAVLATLEEIERIGIRAEIIESKKTTGGYLAIIFFTFDNHKVSIQLEISLRKDEKKGEITTIVNDFVPPYTIMILNKEQLVAEKVQALLTRQKPRDYYDLYFILRADLLPPQKKLFFPKVARLIEKSKISFEQELKVFLPKNQWAIIRDFKTVLTRELQR